MSDVFCDGSFFMILFVLECDLVVEVGVVLVGVGVVFEGFVDSDGEFGKYVFFFKGEVFDFEVDIVGYDDEFVYVYFV